MYSTQGLLLYKREININQAGKVKSGSPSHFRTFLLLLALTVIGLRTGFAQDSPPEEQRTRHLLTFLAAQYEAGLRDLDRAKGRVAPTAYKTLSELKEYLKAQEMLSPLWKTGHVLFVETESESHDPSTPVLIYVADDASLLFRVIYTWESDLAVVRRGTREYERILKLVTGSGHKIEAPENNAVEIDLNPQSFTFIDEHGKPLAGTFGLHERQNRSFLSAWKRSVPVDKRGTVQLEDTPPQFNLFFTSDDGFYSIQRTEHSFTANAVTNVVKIQPTGTLGFTIATYPAGHNEPLVAPCYRKMNGKYVQESGMGIGPSVGQERVFRGLPEGTYKIQLKHNYQDDHVISESEDVEVQVKRHTRVSPFSVFKQDLRLKEIQPSR